MTAPPSLLELKGDRRMDLRERFRASLEKRDSTFLAMMRVSPEQGRALIQRSMDLDDEETDTFLVILLEVLDEIFLARGVGKHEISLLTSERMLEELLGTPLKEAPQEVLENPEFEENILDLLVEESQAEEGWREEIRALYRRKIQERPR